MSSGCWTIVDTHGKLLIWANMVFLNLSTDCLGSIVFARVKSDIAGNITQPSRFKTRQQILEVEKELYGAGRPKVGATLALMWLKRGLRFIQVLLQSLLALKYHGWLVQKLFKVTAVFAAPLQGCFPEGTVQEVKEKDCWDKIRLFLVNFTATIYEMYTKMNAEI
uniref:Glycolipid transfer protein a n=1 Tax=Salmo trutta TaxID=8032 RepID=A0A673Z915_SALTR